MEEQKKEPIVKGSLSQNSRRSGGIIGPIIDEIVVRNFQNLREHLVDDIIIPQTEDFIYGILDDAVGFLRGKGRYSSHRGSGSSREQTSYSSYYDRDRYSRDRRSTRTDEPRKGQTSYKDISFDTRQDALAVLWQMMEDVEGGKYVTVTNYCEYAGCPSNWAENSFGWTDLKNVEVYRDRDGRYYIDLPRPLHIDN